jgi:two-component system response regulator ChvI
MADVVSLKDVFESNAPERIRVVFVEDDDDFREALSAELGDYGLTVRSFRDGQSMLGWISGQPDADVILLDWKLPDISGIDLISELYRRGIDLPVVFLTGISLSTDHEAMAFDRGARDFIDKARGASLLVKRLRLVVSKARRSPQAKYERILRYGALSLCPAAARASWLGKDVNLTLTEFKVLSLMVAHPGRYVTYRQIYDCMHYEGFLAGGGPEGYRLNVRSCIKRMRRKFRACDPDFAELENHPAIGYCWRPHHEDAAVGQAD